MTEPDPPPETWRAIAGAWRDLSYRKLWPRDHETLDLLDRADALLAAEDEPQGSDRRRLEALDELTYLAVDETPGEAIEEALGILGWLRLHHPTGADAAAIDRVRLLLDERYDP